MESIIILKTVFIFILLWGLAAAFLVFRPRVSFVWKMAAFLLFFFYVWFFREEILSGYRAFVEDWYGTLIVFAKEIVFLVFYLLFVFWPVSLIIIFYKADDIGAENLLKFMVIFTLVVWILIAVFVFHRQGADSLLRTRIPAFLPFLQ
ncbi:MAG: hypothetical protein ACOC2H_00050 [Spirochaetota bacterium]